MKNKLGYLLKKVVFAFGILYGINVLLKNVGIYVPINLITLIVTTFLGVPGLISLFAIFYLFKQEVIIAENELEKLINYYRDGKLAHAYLISTNNILKCEKILLKVIKNIFCREKYSDDYQKVLDGTIKYDDKGERILNKNEDAK